MCFLGGRPVIVKWHLFNFKSVKDRIELDFAPLTILAGANSSGKSTLIQSMLLISQSVASRVGSRSVILNGPLCKLGQFDDLKSFGNSIRQIHIGWECQEKVEMPFLPGEQTVPLTLRRNAWKRSGIDEAPLKVSCAIAFDVEASEESGELKQLQPRLSHFELNRTDSSPESSQAWIKVSRLGESDDAIVDKIAQLQIPSKLNDNLTATLAYEVSLDSDSLEELESPQIVGCVLRHFLPSRLTMCYDKVVEEAKLIANVVCEGQRPSRIHFRSNKDILFPPKVLKLLRDRLGEPVLPIIERGSPQPSLLSDLKIPDENEPFTIADWNQGIQRLSFAGRNNLRNRINELKTTLADEITQATLHGSPHVNDLSIRPLPDDLDNAVAYVDAYFSRAVYYLGPLRDEPKPLYPLAANVDPTDVGLKGEYTAAVLDLHRNSRVSYIPTKSFTTSSFTPVPWVASLSEAVRDWLQYLGVAEGFQTTDKGKFGHELRIISTSTFPAHDLTHVGVGVSQVLPILVRCLLANQDTTTIIEQPELHLHPRVQSLLGDFFLSMSLLGKQCIVETHSEYLINRLRLRMASGQSDYLSLLKIYFVNNEEGSSNFVNVVVNEYGAIPEWPKGFFDQSQNEAENILRAAVKRRQQLKQGAF
jgi:predicted ATPase